MIARLVTRRALAALFALTFICTVAPAGAQAPAHAPAPAAILLAKRIVEIKGIKTMFDPLVRGVIEKVKQQFIQTNFIWAKDLNEIAAMMLKEYAPRGEELVDATARIYASHFTETELRDILAFYQTPLGRKMIVEEPKILDESMENAGQFGDNLSVEIINRMRAEMKKRGHDI
jgi:uncharacterized protein